MTSPTQGQQYATAAFKTADEIRCRLFDHKQFTGGEIRFIAKEFEEKRHWREHDKLSSSLDAIRESKIKIDNCIAKFSDESMPDLLYKLQSLQNDSYKVLNQESICEAKRQQRLNDRRKELYAEMSIFELEIGQKKAELDAHYKEKEDAVSDHYTKLEKTLKLDIYLNTRQDL